MFKIIKSAPNLHQRYYWLIPTYGLIINYISHFCHYLHKILCLSLKSLLNQHKFLYDYFKILSN